MLDCGIMEFITQKIVSALTLPLPLAIIFLLIGLCFFWMSHKKIIANIFLTSGFLLLMISSFSFFPSVLLNSLEHQYQPIKSLPKNIHKIVVLGGGVRSDTSMPANTQLKAASLSRLIEGIRLYHLYQSQHQSVLLILSGGRVFGSPAEAGVMQNIAIILGVNIKDIKLEAGSRDTHEEALYLKKQVGNQPFFLVTSAYHMPRAMALFKKLGLQPIAAPTQYMSDIHKNGLDVYLPSSNYLVMSDVAIHEYLGQWWGKLMHEIK